MPSRHTPPPQASSQARRRMSSPGISQGAPRLRPAPGRHSTSGQRLCPAPPVVRGHQARYHSTPAMRAYPGSHPPAGSHTASSQGTGSQDPRPASGRPPGGRPGRGWGPGRQRPPHPRSSRHHHTPHHRSRSRHTPPGSRPLYAPDGAGRREAPPRSPQQPPVHIGSRGTAGGDRGQSDRIGRR